MWNLKNKTNKNQNKTETDIDTETKWVVTREEGEKGEEA